MSLGLTADGVRELHDVAERHIGDDQVPGLVMLVVTGDQVHAGALGKLAIGEAPVARDSIFQREFESSDPPRVHVDIQTGAYAALG